MKYGLLHTENFQACIDDSLNFTVQVPLFCCEEQGLIPKDFVCPCTHGQQGKAQMQSIQARTKLLKRRSCSSVCYRQVLMFLWKTNLPVSTYFWRYSSKHHISNSLPAIELSSITQRLFLPVACRYSDVLAWSESRRWSSWWIPIVSRRWEWKCCAAEVHAVDKVGSWKKVKQVYSWSHCVNYDSGYIRLVVVLKGESTSYLGPAVLHLIKMYYGRGLWSASRQVLVTALFFEVFTETIISEK